jgi:hypothetical protein
MPRTENEELIQAYFRMVEEDDYAAIGSLLNRRCHVDHRAHRLYVEGSRRDRIHGRRGGPHTATRQTLTG